MLLNHLSCKLTKALHGFLAVQFKVVLTLAAILFVANLAYSAYTLGFTDGQAFESSRNYTISGDTTFMLRLRVATSLGLLICVTGLALRRLYGVFASMLGIFWLVVVYCWWKRKSVSFLGNLEMTDYSALPDVSHALGLRDASLWDVFVLVIAVILLVWQVVAIVRVLRSSDDGFSSGTSLLIQTSMCSGSFRTLGREHIAISGLTFLMALVSLIYTWYEAGQIERTRLSGGFLTEFPYTLNGLHLSISLILLLCAVGLWLRRLAGLLISATGFLGILLIFGYWHWQTNEYLKEFYAVAQNYSRFKAEVGLFHGASRWDFVMLALVAVLFLWHLIKLTKIVFQQGRYFGTK